MSNRRRTSSDLSLEIIDISKNIQYNSKPIQIKPKRRQRDHISSQTIAISPTPSEYIVKDGEFIKIIKKIALKYH
jgi:hypothetical protein